MSRLSLLMGIFLASTVTGIVLLLGVIGKVSASNIIFRGTVIFFIFGSLGTFLGSFLEILILPITTEKEVVKLKDELKFEDDQIKAELGDLLDDDSNKNKVEFGTPTDELEPVVLPRMTSKSNEADSAMIS